MLSKWSTTELHPQSIQGISKTQNKGQRRAGSDISNSNQLENSLVASLQRKAVLELNVAGQVPKSPFCPPLGLDSSSAHL
jgi:hypothetical protein